MEAESKISKEENFVQVNDAVTGIIIFTTQSNLECLCRQITDIIIDGTFKSCPKFFDQIYSIHGCKHGNYVPLIFALLPSRTQKCYTEFWTHVIRICEERHLILCPDAIHIYFEQAMISVTESVSCNEGQMLQVSLRPSMVASNPEAWLKRRIQRQRRANWKMAEKFLWISIFASRGSVRLFY